LPIFAEFYGYTPAEFADVQLDELVELVSWIQQRRTSD
jgi:hypothetical protein